MPTVERHQPDFSKGGVIAVILGHGGVLPEQYEHHPFVRPIDARLLDAKNLHAHIPANARLLIFGGGKKMEPRLFNKVHDLLKQRRVPYMIRVSDDAVRDAIASALPKNGTVVPLSDIEQADADREAAAAEAPPTGAGESPPPAPRTTKAIAPHGALKAFVDLHAPRFIKEDATMATATMARHLFRLAQDTGLQTTLGSIAQGISVWKRGHRVGERPQSVIPAAEKARNGIDGLIDTLTTAVAQLTAYRDHFATIEAENASVKLQLARAKEAFDMFRADVFDKEA